MELNINNKKCTPDIKSIIYKDILVLIEMTVKTMLLKFISKSTYNGKYGMSGNLNAYCETSKESGTFHSM